MEFNLPPWLLAHNATKPSKVILLQQVSAIVDLADVQCSVLAFALESAASAYTATAHIVTGIFNRKLGTVGTFARSAPSQTQAHADSTCQAGRLGLLPKGSKAEPCRTPRDAAQKLSVTSQRLRIGIRIGTATRQGVWDPVPAVSLAASLGPTGIAVTATSGNACDVTSEAAVRELRPDPTAKHLSGLS